MSTTTPAPPTRDEPRFVTDGGLETDLIFHHGVDLPCFAAYPLLADADGRRLLHDYYGAYADIAAAAGAGLMLESPTWRANPDWGAQLGDDVDALTRVNTAAVDFMRELADEHDGRVPQVLVGGTIGPRGDGYRPGARVDPDEARDYHLPQMRALADAGADVVSALTLTDPGEAIGIVAAAREVGVPVAIGFTVETDGHLPGGQTLAGAIGEVDAVGGPEDYLVNCAHPAHVLAGVDADDPATRAAWERVAGIRANASRQSHAELDESEQLDEGDLADFVDTHQLLADIVGHFTIVGGCCGTDARHVAALWGVGQPSVG